MGTSFRRRVVLAAALALAAAGVVAAWWGNPGVVRAVGWGDVVRWPEWEPVSPRVPWLRLPHERRVYCEPGSVWVVVDRSATRAGEECAWLVAACGCRIVGSRLGVSDRVVTVWQQLPSLGPVATIAVDVDGREHVVTVERSSPVPVRVISPDRPVLPMPWSGDVPGGRIDLRETDGIVFVRWRPAGESPPIATARDYDCRIAEIPRKLPDWERWSDIPFGTRLCPHGPWWEIEFANPGAEPTVLRFACPTAWTLPSAPK